MRWGKLSKSVELAAAANSNKGSLIDTWPRITSGFTSNCSAVHRLKRQPRVAGRASLGYLLRYAISCSCCSAFQPTTGKMTARITNPQQYHRDHADIPKHCQFHS